jgi:hypothetical protein
LINADLINFSGIVCSTQKEVDMADFIREFTKKLEQADYGKNPDLIVDKNGEIKLF